MSAELLRHTTRACQTPISEFAQSAQRLCYGWHMSLTTREQPGRPLSITEPRCPQLPRRMVEVAALVLFTLGCSKGDPDNAGVSLDSARALGAAQETDERDRVAVDEQLLDRVIDRRIVIYVAAPHKEVRALRDRYTEEEFQIIADDLMFYRATAIEYLENQGYPLLRLNGRRPVTFQIAGAPRLFEFADIKFMDFVVLYERNREPRVLAPNEVDAAAAYFGRGD